MIAINDVVIPVPRSQFQSVGTLKAEGAFPGARLGVADNRERQLVLVSIPRSDEMNSLDIRGGAKSERKLYRRNSHFRLRCDCDYCLVDVVTLLIWGNEQLKLLVKKGLRYPDMV